MLLASTKDDEVISGFNSAAPAIIDTLPDIGVNQQLIDSANESQAVVDARTPPNQQSYRERIPGAVASKTAEVKAWVREKVEESKSWIKQKKDDAWNYLNYLFTSPSETEKDKAQKTGQVPIN